MPRSCETRKTGPSGRTVGKAGHRLLHAVGAHVAQAGIGGFGIAVAVAVHEGVFFGLAVIALDLRGIIGAA